MKKFLIIFCSTILITTVTVFAYNSDKGPARQTDGITELPQPAQDSVLKHGKYLIDKSNFSKEDMKAIAAYLNNK